MLVHLPQILKSLALLAAILAVNTFLFGQSMDNRGIVFICVVSNLVELGLARSRRRIASRRDGWSYLTISLAQWLIAAVMIGLTGFFLYMFYFVGSARADAATQMVWLQVLIGGFGVLTAIMGWCTFASFTRWNGDCIEQDTVLIGRRAIRFGDIAEVRVERWSDSLRIVGIDGAVIRIPKMNSGSSAFAEELAYRLDLLPPEPEPHGEPK